MSFVRPPRVPPDARIHAVAPAGWVDGARLDRGLARLRAARPELAWVLADNLRVRTGYFAGDDEARTLALQAALGDPDAHAIWCARGGYGTTRILSRLDATPFRHRPKCIVGFSDVTALLAWAWTAAGVPSIHGPVLGQLATLDDRDLEHVLDLLAGEVPPPLEAEQGSVLVGGKVEGHLVAANLVVLCSLIGTRFFPALDGAILALEEVGERPYRIDRSLTQLVDGGALRGVRGLVVGQLTGCREPEDGGSQGPSATQVVEERLARLGVPVVTGFPFGHDAARNVALPFGTPVRLAADDATLVFLEPVTG